MVRVLARRALRALFIALLASPLAAKELAIDNGAIVDMPSGFTPGDGEGTGRHKWPAAELDNLTQAFSGDASGHQFE